MLPVQYICSPGAAEQPPVLENARLRMLAVGTATADDAQSVWGKCRGGIDVDNGCGDEAR